MRRSCALVSLLGVAALVLVLCLSGGRGSSPAVAIKVLRVTSDLANGSAALLDVKLVRPAAVNLYSVEYKVGDQYNFRFWRERHRAKCEARGGRRSAATCNRRATKQLARCRPAPAGWGYLACWLRFSHVTGHFGHAPRSCLASKPNSLQQNRNLFLNGP